MSALQKVPEGERKSERPGKFGDVYIKVLDANAQYDQAQTIRLASYWRYLHSGRLRNYLDRLPEAHAIIVEDEALRHAMKFDPVERALEFFTEWTAPEWSARLIIERHMEFKVGSSWRAIEKLAQKIEGISPLAAVVMRRRIIDETLDKRKWAYYAEAARQLLVCKALHLRISCYEKQEPHPAYVSALRSKFRNCYTFWNYVRAAGGWG